MNKSTTLFLDGRIYYSHYTLFTHRDRLSVRSSKQPTTIQSLIKNSEHLIKDLII